ncbi:MAG: hypothetical protein ACE147_02530 [Candidatus Methylomirabilales bacterium]
MPSPPDPPALVAGLPARIPGLRAALLLDPVSGHPLARAARDAGEDLALLAARAARLLDAARQARQPGEGDPLAEVRLEAEGASLVLLAVPAGTLCLLLHPDASAARAAFEARRLFGRMA